MAARVLVLCGRDRAAALPEIAARLDVVGLVRVGRAYRSPIDAATVAAPTAAASAAGLEVDAVVVLSPYGSMADDVAAYRAASLPVLMAGPLPAGATTGTVEGGRWRHIAAARGALEIRRRPAFGRAVYLRHVIGGGNGLLPAWWALLESLEAAAELLDDSVARLWIGAVTRRGRWQVTATAIAAHGASAQLVVAPTPDPGDDLLLLGTGGLVQTDGAGSAATVRDDRGSRGLAVPDPWPDADWIEASLATTDAPPGDPRPARTILTALRRAARSGRLQSVPVGD